MYKQILEELKEHMPFTAFGAATGIILIIFFKNYPPNLPIIFSISFTLSMFS